LPFLALVCPDGAEQGTRLMSEIETGINGSDPTEIFEYGAKLLVSATSAMVGNEVWIADVPADSPLPLQLLEFKGSVVNSDGLLQWKTDNELNTASFVLERSIDGRNYSAIGSVASANSPGIHYYDFTDANITSLGIADFYYRLKQTDIDGKYTYSNIVVLSVTCGKSFVLLYPNPVNDKINMTINVSQKEKMQWQLTDNMGRRIKAGSYDLSPGSMAVSIDIANLSSGMYLIQLNSAYLQKVIKVVKQ
jgi:trimeric autotransporter adhesin